MSAIEGSRPRFRGLIERIRTLEFLEDSGLAEAQSFEELLELTRRRRNNSARAYLRIGVTPEVYELSAILSTSNGGEDEADKVVLRQRFGSFTSEFMGTDQGLDIQARFALAGVSQLDLLKETARVKKTSIVINASVPRLPSIRLDESSLLARAIQRGLEPLQPQQELP
jgi:hypothetical protein